MFGLEMIWRQCRLAFSSANFHSTPIVSKLVFVILVLLVYPVESYVSQSFQSQICSFPLFFPCKSVILFFSTLWFCFLLPHLRETLAESKHGKGRWLSSPALSQPHRDNDFSCIRLSKYSGLTSRLSVRLRPRLGDSICPWSLHISFPQCEINGWLRERRHEQRRSSFLTNVLELLGVKDAINSN